MDSQTRKSVWIIIQPSKHTQELLEQTLQDQEQKLYGPESNPMLLHTVILQTTSGNWEGYIEYLYSRFLEIVSRIVSRLPKSIYDNILALTYTRTKEGASQDLRIDLAMPTPSLFQTPKDCKDFVKHLRELSWF